MRNRTVLAVLVASLLLGLSPLSADTVIQRGIDVFSTTANGTTFYDFSHNPIPAGFFCKSFQSLHGPGGAPGAASHHRSPGKSPG